MADIFFDFNRGSDANDGLTRKTPKKNLTPTALNVNVGAGNAILLASDSRWEIPGNKATNVRASIFMLNGAGDNSRVYITSYDPAGNISKSKPTISSKFVPTSADWTWDSGLKAWYIQFAYTYNSLDVWSKLNGKYLVNINQNNPYTGNAATDYAKLRTTYNGMTDNDYRIWTNATGNRVYFWGPGLDNPLVDPNLALGAGCLELAEGGFLRVYECGRYLTIDGLRTEHGTGLVLHTAANANIILPGLEVLNCETYDTSVSFEVSINSGDAGLAYVEHQVRQCHFERMAGYAIKTYGRGVTGDVSFSTLNQGNNCHSFGGTVYHGSKPPLNSNATKTVKYCTFDGARNGVSNSAYDGCALYADSPDDNTYFYGNVIKNCFKAAQVNTGKRFYFSGNIAINCDQLITGSDEANYGEIDYRINNNLLYNTTLMRFPRGSTAMQVPAAMSIRAFANNATGLVKIECKNNVILGDNTPPGSIGIRLGYPNNWSKIDAGTNYVSGFDNPVMDFGIPGSGGATDRTAFASTITGGLLDFISPETGDFRLGKDSVLKGAGTPLSLPMRDFFGVTFDERSPSVGIEEPVN